MKKIALTFCFLTGLIISGYCYYGWPDSSQQATCIDPVICRLDSMALTIFSRSKFYADDEALLASVNTPYDQLPKYTDEQIVEKMKLIPSVIPMNYNSTIRQFIEFFAYKRRGLMAQCLANSQLYFPIFEEALDRKGLPIELKYLPVVESALNPVAISRAGATGLWQMIYSTGTLMGLTTNSYIDERRDPVKETEAATEYLKRLYDMYGDWQLVLAAYNSGPGFVNKAIARAGGRKNFWAILPYLPAETRSYVPTYIAALYVMYYYKDFNLLSCQPRHELYDVDTVIITSKVSLQHVSDVLNIPADELQFLNPSIKTGIIPLTANGFPMNLPISYIGLFEAKKEEIMNDTSLVVQNYQPPVEQKTRVFYYKVKAKETLGYIAAKFRVSVAAIKQTNKLKNNVLYTGQQLKIVRYSQIPAEEPKYTQVFAVKPIGKSDPTPEPVIAGAQDTVPVTGNANDSIDTSAHVQLADSALPDSSSKTASNIEAPGKASAQCGCIYFVVQQGDTLWNIAQRYQGLTVDKLKADNRDLLTHPLKPGDVIKIVTNN